MREKLKTIFKRCKFPFIMSIITFVIGCFFVQSSVGIPFKEQLVILLISFLPFIIFIGTTLLSYRFSRDIETKNMFNWITGILVFFLLLYYLIAIFICGFIVAFNPITDEKYYKHYVNSSYLTKVFPKNIPRGMDNIHFYYAPGILQRGTNYSLYYIDKNLTKEEFDKRYREKAIWIGCKSEYAEKSGLLASAFSFTPVDYNDEDNYIIYLVDRNCDDSGYCNHGKFLFVAYNEETHEVIFRAEFW